jgi:hypothetical protein
MQKLFLSLILLVISESTFSQTNYPSGVSGCIARWTFDAAEGGVLDSIYDVSGNLNHGTNHNIVSTNGWRNVAGKAGDFNGSSSWSEVMSKAMLCPSEVTIIALVKMKAFNSGPCQGDQFLSKGYPYFVPGNYGLGLVDNYYDGDCNVFSPNNTQLGGQCGSGTFNVPAGNYVSLNKWYFFAMTLNSSAVKLYQIEMDTNLMASSITPISTIAGTYNLGTNTQNISIGKHLNPTYPYFSNADMDEVILFNKVLTDQELLTVYNYLYGAPTSTNEVNPLDNITITSINKNINISTTSSNYDIVIHDLFGNIIYKKMHCQSKEIINLDYISQQLLMIEIHSNNKSQFKKLLLN